MSGESSCLAARCEPHSPPCSHVARRGKTQVLASPSHCSPALSRLTPGHRATRPCSYRPRLVLPVAPPEQRHQVRCRCRRAADKEDAIMSSRAMIGPHALPWSGTHCSSSLGYSIVGSVRRHITVWIAFLFPIDPPSVVQAPQVHSHAFFLAIRNDLVALLFIRLICPLCTIKKDLL